MNCFIVCLCGCAVQDLRSRKISNLWIAAGVAAGSLLSGGRFWLSAAMLLVFGWWLYYFRMVGAGDLKMMAMICGFMGIERGICAIGTSFGICGLVSLAGMYIRFGSGNKLRERLNYFSAWLRRLIQTKERIVYYDRQRDGASFGIPLGSYLCAGTLCYLAFCGWKGVL